MTDTRCSLRSATGALSPSRGASKFTRHHLIGQFGNRNYWQHRHRPLSSPMSVQDISEHPPLSRSRDWSFYVVFFFAVLPLWSSVPLAWFFAGYSLYDFKWLTYGTIGRAFFFVACCEVSARCGRSNFYLQLFPYRYSSASTMSTSHVASLDRHHMAQGTLMKFR